MPPVHIQVQIDLDGIAGKVQQLLKSASYMASIGVRATDEISTASLEMPELHMVHQYDHTNPWQVPEAKANWRRWVLTNAFRDIAEISSGVLEEVQRVLSIWALIGHSPTGATIPAKRWNSEVVQRAEQFHRRTLPQKLDYLKSHYDFEPNPSDVAMIMSVNAARNCFVHRSGVVGEPDLDESGCLTLRWHQLTAFITEGDEERELTLPYYAEKDALLSLKSLEMSRTFSRGQEVSIELPNFSGLCWTIFTFAQHCGHDLQAYAKGRGMTVREKAP